MKKHEIYFSSECGISLTNANFLANLDKELYRPFERKLMNLSFVTTKVKLLAYDSLNITTIGKDDATFIPELLEKISAYKSLISWLREAIKAHTALVDEINKASFEYFGIELPERPERLPTLTADDVMGEWSIKQREEYLRLEQYAATYGSIVHPDGSFSKARIKLLDALDAPNKLDGDRLYINEPTCFPDEVDDIYLHVQQTARSYQARLNAIKAQVLKAVSESEQAEKRRFKAANDMYDVGYAKAVASLEECKTRELARINALKIVIPDHLKPIYDEVNKSGKDNSEK